MRDSTVMAVASTAPAYSLAATMAAMVAAVGLASPAAILVSFLPVLGIAIAYFYMNSTNPDCGASYSWFTQSVSPWLGPFTGWVQTAASLIGMFLLLFIFLFASSAMQALVPRDTIVNQGSNAMQYFAQQVMPAPWSNLMLLAVLSSTVATVQTPLLPAARVTLSMARDGVWPRVFLRIHSRFKTPWAGTLILAVIATIGLLLTSFSPDQGAILADLVGGIGVLVGFYYGITGLACAWYFRRLLRRDMATLVFAGIVPFVSGLLLFVVGIGAVVSGEQQSGWISVPPCLIALALGLPFTLLAWWRNKAYFAYRPTAYDGGVTSEA